MTRQQGGARATWPERLKPVSAANLPRVDPQDKTYGRRIHRSRGVRTSNKIVEKSRPRSDVAGASGSRRYEDTHCSPMSSAQRRTGPRASSGRMRGAVTDGSWVCWGRRRQSNGMCCIIKEAGCANPSPHMNGYYGITLACPQRAGSEANFDTSSVEGGTVAVGYLVILDRPGSSHCHHPMGSSAE